MPEELPDFRPTIDCLVEANIRFVLIGGLAMITRGATHFTTDVDISFDQHPSNLEPLVKVLKANHARLRGVPEGLPFILDVKIFQNTHNFTFVTDIGDIDLLAEPAGVDSFEGLWDRATEMDIYGKTVRVASIDDLIAMKRAADRPKDRLHVLELEDLRQFILDEAASGGNQ